MPGVLFLDLARRAGIAHAGPSPGLPVTQLWRLPDVEGSADGGREYGRLFGTFRQKLVDLIAVVQPSVLGFEAAIPIMGAGSPVRRGTTNESAIRVLWGLASVAEETAYSCNVAAYELSIATVKKHITGMARAEKEMVIRAVQRLGVDVGDPPDDNRADAAAGWFCLSSLTDKKFRPGSDTALFGRRA